MEKEFAESAQDYMCRANLSVKGLDFAQLGGLIGVLAPGRPARICWSVGTRYGDLGFVIYLAIACLPPYLLDAIVMQPNTRASAPGVATAG